MSARAAAHGLRALRAAAAARVRLDSVTHRPGARPSCCSGLVMVTSASVSIAGQESGQPFSYLERQLLLTLIGARLRGAGLLRADRGARARRRCRCWASRSRCWCWCWCPGSATSVNGSRRWLRLAGINFQVSELARVLVLIYIASYAVRREDAAARAASPGLREAARAARAASRALLLAEPDFGAATVLFATGFGLLFLAGARLRYVIAMTALAAARLRAAGGELELPHAPPDRLPRSLGRSVQQRLPAHAVADRHRPRPVVRRRPRRRACRSCSTCPRRTPTSCSRCSPRSSGWPAWCSTLALFLALVWRSFHIARLAADAGLKFRAYLAAGFGLWVGIQAFINIGVNMGVLPTKGLTLPLMSYGRSSLIVALAWVGLLLRVHHEAMREQRGSAHRAGRAHEPADPHHGRRHRRARVSGAGAGAPAARAVLEVVWLGTAARARGARRAGRGHSDRVAVDRRPARQGRARPGSPRRFAWAARCCRRLRSCAATGRWWSWAWAASSPGPAASPPG